MAKNPKKKPEKIGGPFLATAVFCDQVLEEKPTAEGKSGVVSLIRVYDSVTAGIPSELPTDVIPGVRLKLFLSFRAGDAKPSHTVRLVTNTPDGQKHESTIQKFRFSGAGQHGYNLTINLELPAKVEGVYWFDVILDGERVNRIPLNLLIRREPPEKSKGS